MEFSSAPEDKNHKEKTPIPTELMLSHEIEVVGFEPTAFWSRTKRATRLRYTSKKRSR